MIQSLSRKDNHRQSLVRNLATSLVLYEQIKTTRAKAKVVKSEVEHLLNIAKKNDLTSRRRLIGYFFDPKATDKVFEVLVPRYKKINSGFIMTFKIGPRLGDGAEMAILKLQEDERSPIKESTGEKDDSKKDIKNSGSKEKLAKESVDSDKKVAGKNSKNAKN